jgi:2-(1,2-epoxy-1,2-dihydrophenyl)acetyl-CoA isomerase
MAYEVIILEKQEHVAILTLNRPERLNALSRQLQEEVHAAIDEIQADDAVRALIITGAGRGFCSGADLRGAQPGASGAAPQPGAHRDLLDEDSWMGRWAKMFHRFDKPLIAAVNGVAAGAGMSTAVAADLRVGCENSRFKTVFLERSLSPDSGMSFFLPRIIGYSRAADLIFTSRAVDAEEAYRLGLLDRLVKADVLIEESVKLANEMAQWPPLALRVSKRVLQRNFENDLDTAVRYETHSLEFGRKAVNDVRESRLAFIEKRKGSYTGT